MTKDEAVLKIEKFIKETGFNLDSNCDNNYVLGLRRAVEILFKPLDEPTIPVNPPSDCELT